MRSLASFASCAVLSVTAIMASLENKKPVQLLCRAGFGGLVENAAVAEFVKRPQAGSNRRCQPQLKVCRHDCQPDHPIGTMAAGSRRTARCWRMARLARFSTTPIRRAR